MCIYVTFHHEVGGIYPLHFDLIFLWIRSWNWICDAQFYASMRLSDEAPLFEFRCKMHTLCVLFKWLCLALRIPSLSYIDIHEQDCFFLYTVCMCLHICMHNGIIFVRDIVNGTPYFEDLTLKGSYNNWFEFIYIYLTSISNLRCEFITPLRMILYIS